MSVLGLSTGLSDQREGMSTPKYQSFIYYTYTHDLIYRYPLESTKAIQCSFETLSDRDEIRKLCLEPFLPESVDVAFPNMHLNILSPLLRGHHGKAFHGQIDQSLAFLKESDYPIIQQYLEENTVNSLITAIAESVSA